MSCTSRRRRRCGRRTGPPRRSAGSNKQVVPFLPQALSVPEQRPGASFHTRCDVHGKVCRRQQRLHVGAVLLPRPLQLYVVLVQRRDGGGETHPRLLAGP